MTNDPMLEKWIEENRFPRDGNKNPEHQSFVIREVDLRAFMRGKRIVEDVPVAYRWYTPRSGMWDEHVALGKPPMSQSHMIQPLYAAPSDTEVGNG